MPLLNDSDAAARLLNRCFRKCATFVGFLDGCMRYRVIGKHYVLVPITSTEPIAKMIWKAAEGTPWQPDLERAMLQELI